MGYETTMYVMLPHHGNFSGPRTGSTLASIELRKCGHDTNVGLLIVSKTKKLDGTPPWALYARNPDRQHEAVDFLRNVVKDVMPGKEDYITDLADNIEDGLVTTDRYGHCLGVMEIDDMITAMRKDNEREPYRRFTLALALLESIKSNFPEVVKVVTYGH